jgi:hypothetical protein
MQTDSLLHGQFNDSDNDLSDLADSRRDSLDLGKPLSVLEAEQRRAQRSWWRVLMEGPLEPVEPKVTLIFPKLQSFPDEIRSRIPPGFQRALFFLYLILWSVLFLSLANKSILATPSINGEAGDLLRCHMTPQVWKGKNEWCGLNGEECFASEVGQEFRFKCPADCIKESWTYSATPVGSFESIYRPFVVGGNNSYRADSYICGSAIHHGIVSNTLGGCGIIRFTGPRSGFVSEVSGGGIESIGIDAEFPASYSFVDTFGMTLSGCHDLRMPIIATNIILSVVYGYFVSGAGSFLFGLVICGFWTVILASNPPLAGGEELADAELISLGFKRLLPGLLTTYVIYAFATKPQLEDMPAHFSRAVFWVFGFWIGILENFVFANLPLDRLTISDLNSQSGAWLALVSIIVLVGVIAVGQGYVIWRMGKFKPYIQYYLAAILVLVALSFVPNETLRVHHYIWTLILLPGTGVKTTPSLLYQGLLVGLFVSGIARWDFDSILQTYEQLRRGAPSLRGGLVTLLAPTIGDSSSGLKDIVLNWQSLEQSQLRGAADKIWDGFSLVIDDVERYRGPVNSFNLTDWALNSLNYTTVPLKYYIRIAFAQIAGRTGDYTRAGAVSLDSGAWQFPPAGAI